MAEVTPHDPGPTDGRPFVVLGVSAGIAAYKAVEVCRRLVDAGCHVAPVLTERATRFVGRATFDALGSEPTQTSVFDEVSPIPHTRLGQRADVVVVAPATADLLARYAAGLADDLLTTTLVATAAPVVVCPAMHTEMWEHPAVQANLGVLAARGVTVVPPEEGRLAGGDVGSGRMAEPATIAAAVLGLLGSTGASRHDLTGVRVLVSAGGTREAIDPVRFITNRSSGKQGHAVAAAARRRGAEVVLVTTSSQPRPPGAEVVEVETAAQMQRAMLERAADADVVVMAAAVADFRPKVVVDTKLHKSDGVPELVLEPTDDILAELGRRRRAGQVLVGSGGNARRARAGPGQAGGQGRRPDGRQRRLGPPGGIRPRHRRGDDLRGRRDGPGVPLSAKSEVADALFVRVVPLLVPPS